MEENKMNQGEQMNQNINTINEQKVDNNNENKGRGLFYFVIALAIIIIAAVGATYAYFTATTNSSTNQISAGSTAVSLNMTVDSARIKENLIPVADNIAEYSYAMQSNEEAQYTYDCKTYSIEGDETSECQTYYTAEDADAEEHRTKTANAVCTDDSGADLCSTYTFTISNPITSPQTLSFSLYTTENTFENLYYALYKDVSGVRTRVSEAGAVNVSSGGYVDIEPITLTADENATEEEIAEINAQNLEYSNLLHQTIAQDESATYTLIVWIHEIEDNQTDADGNKNFSGYIEVKSGDSERGVTGQIAVASGYIG